MDQPGNHSMTAKTVEVEFRDGKWFVLVLDDNKQDEREFLFESHATSFADGQRMRLGLFSP